MAPIGAERHLQEWHYRPPHGRVRVWRIRAGVHTVTVEVDGDHSPEQARRLARVILNAADAAEEREKLDGGATRGE